MYKAIHLLSIVIIIINFLTGCSLESGNEKEEAISDTQLSAGITKTAEVSRTQTPVPSATATPIPTNTLIPSATPTSTPTWTLTPIPLADLRGLLFFDYNGNSFRDDDEPPLVSFGVCAEISANEKACVDTNAEGQFLFEEVAREGSAVSLSFIDPGTDDPAIAFRYVNVPKGDITIPAYNISGTEAPTQHLTDTEIIPIENTVRARIGDPNEFGLMQGFLTLPFLSNEQPSPFIMNYFDILDTQTICNDVPFDWDGIGLNFNGRYSSTGNQYRSDLSAGVNSGHNGLDYLVPIGMIVIHAGPTAIVKNVVNTDAGEILVFVVYNVGTDILGNTYSHLSKELVRVGQTIHRGSIVGLSGDTGPKPNPPQLHFDLYKEVPGDNCKLYLDPYRTTYYISSSTLPNNFSGNFTGFWTIDNNPQHFQ